MLAAVPSGGLGPRSFADVVAEWERAYEGYRSAFAAAVSQPGRVDLAGQVAHAAGRVAGLWCELMALPGLEYWALAGLAAASEAMADVAQEWASFAGDPAGVGPAEQTVAGFRAVPSPVRRVHPSPAWPRGSGRQR